MPIALVGAQLAGNSQSSSPATQAFPAPVTAGNFIVMVAASVSLSGASTPSAGGAYSLIVARSQMRRW